MLVHVTCFLNKSTCSIKWYFLELKYSDVVCLKAWNALWFGAVPGKSWQSWKKHSEIRGPKSVEWPASTNDPNQITTGNYTEYTGWCWCSKAVKSDTTWHDVFVVYQKKVVLVLPTHQDLKCRNIPDVSFGRSLPN